MEAIDSNSGPLAWMRVPEVPAKERGRGPVIPAELGTWGAAERALGRLDQALDEDSSRGRWLAQARRLDVAQGQAMEGRLVTAELLARRLIDPAWSPGRAHRIDQAVDVWRALRTATGATYSLTPSTDDLEALARRATLSSWPREEEAPDDLFPEGRVGLEQLVERWADLPAGGLPAAGEALRILYEDVAFGRYTIRLARVLAPLLVRRFAGTRHPCLFLGRAMARRHQAFGAAAAAGQRAWTRLFLTAAHEAAQDGLQLKITLDHAYRSLMARCSDSRASSRLHQAVAILFEQPVFYAEDLAKALQISRTGANEIIARLTELRAIEETSHRKRYRLYCARTIIEAGGW